VSAQVAAGGTCPLKGTFFALGTSVAGKPTTVSDGDANGNAPAHVSCSVAAAGSGFDVTLNASTDGPSGASFSIQSTAGQGAVTPSGGSVLVTFKSAVWGPYLQNDCTMTFTYEGAPVPATPPVAPGRIWGHVSCPAAVGADGTGCDAEADLLFEQCAEQ
jgi:hypothetical protein